VLLVGFDFHARVAKDNPLEGPKIKSTRVGGDAKKNCVIVFREEGGQLVERGGNLLVLAPGL
jgi:hypothetical protein